MNCLYVCIKEVTDRASGYDFPVYAKWSLGAVAWFHDVPDKRHWRELAQWTASDGVMTAPINDRLEPDQKGGTP